MNDIEARIGAALRSLEEEERSGARTPSSSRQRAAALRQRQTELREHQNALAEIDKFYGDEAALEQLEKEVHFRTVTE